VQALRRKKDGQVFVTAGQTGFSFTGEALRQRVVAGFALRALVLVLAACFMLDVKVQAGGTVPDCLEATLRAAMAGGGTVLFVNGNCSLTLGAPLTIQTDTVLDAGTNQITLSASNQFRVFTVAPSIHFEMRGITVTAGQNAIGGALYIDTNAVVLLTNCTFLSNRAPGSNGVAGINGADNSNGSGRNGGSGGDGVSAAGGAVYNLGMLSVLNCIFTSNSVTGGDGGNGGNGGDGTGTLATGGNGGNGGAGGTALGGAIFNSGSLLLSNCTVAGNSIAGGDGGSGGTNGTGNGGLGYPGSGGAGTSASGAGIYSTLSFTTLNTTFSGNVARGGNSLPAGTSSSNGQGYAGPDGASSFGGALCALDGVALTNCTVSANSVSGGNGGDGGDSRGTLAKGGKGGNGGSGVGGGLYAAGTTFVVNCTLADGQARAGTNGAGGTGFTAGNPGAMGVATGAGIANGSGVFTLQNTILSTNLALVAGTTFSANASGAITDAGHNLSSDSTPSLILPGDLPNTDPKLGPLVDNGGPTLTRALIPGSPTIDAISFSSLKYPPFDQRGVPRPQGTGADIGAYELASPALILSHPMVVSNAFTFTYQTLYGLSYVLQYKNEISNATWIPLLTNSGTGGLITNADSPINLPSRFYRLQVY
jgi:hypothetical protein